MPNKSKYLCPLAGQFWRSTFLETEDRLLSPASAAHGRWHHDGQKALYLSQTVKGCKTSLRVYRKDRDPPRGLFPLEVIANRIVDLRRYDVRRAFDTTLSDIHAFWNDLHQSGAASPTWALSDQLRELNADGILAPSRSRPDLTHLTLFRWNTPSAPIVRRNGPPLTWLD